jgi:transcriptional regulator with XRE-family HTH domain
MTAREIGTMLRLARVQAGMRQIDLARQMHTSQSAIGRVEAGTYMPQVSTMQKWAQITGKRLQIKLT